MSNIYRESLRATDPEVTVKLPIDIMEDMAVHADVLGQSIERYVACALAKSLETVEEDFSEHLQLKDDLYALLQTEKAA